MIKVMIMISIIMTKSCDHENTLNTQTLPKKNPLPSASHAEESGQDAGHAAEQGVPEILLNKSYRNYGYGTKRAPFDRYEKG